MTIISSYKYDVLRRAITELLGTDVSLERINSSKEEVFKFGVNWCAKGVQTPAVARDFGYKLGTAGVLADSLNGLAIKVDWSRYADCQPVGNGITNDTLACAHMLVNLEKYDFMLVGWLEGEYELDYDKGNLRRTTNTIHD